MKNKMEPFVDVANYFEDDEYEHIRPIARQFRNTELIGTKFNNEDQGHFLQEEFIAAIYWHNNDRETKVERKVQIPDVSPTVVATFVKYLETQVIMDDINEDNLEELLKIAKWFNYQDLKSTVFNWMLLNLGLDNALKFYSLNKQYSIGGMSTFQMFVLKNFKKLNQATNGFPDIPKATLDAWLGNDNLGVKDEELFEIINGWGKDRISLMVHVRFCKMSESYLKEKVINSDNIKDYPRTVCTLVDKCRQYSLPKGRCSLHNHRNPNLNLSLLWVDCVQVKDQPIALKSLIPEKMNGISVSRGCLDQSQEPVMAWVSLEKPFTFLEDVKGE